MEAIAKNAMIGALILEQVAYGKTLPEAIDGILGAGTYAKIASDTYDALRK